MIFAWDLDPVLFKIGPLTLSWYGLYFAGGFFAGLQIMQWIYRREGLPAAELDRLLWYVIAGVVVGMRLVHCSCYDPQYYFANPLEVVRIWRGGSDC